MPETLPRLSSKYTIADYWELLFENQSYIQILPIYKSTKNIGGPRKYIFKFRLMT
jgi:hypothetical protein